MSQRKITVCDLCSKEIAEGAPVTRVTAHEEGNGNARYADVHAACLNTIDINFTERARRGRRPVAA